MKKILYSHPNSIIGAFASAFLCILIALYFFAVNDVFAQIRRALIVPVPQEVGGFDFAAAAKLDLRGLVTSAPSGPAAPGAPAATTTAPTP